MPQHRKRKSLYTTILFGTSNPITVVIRRPTTVPSTSGPEAVSGLTCYFPPDVLGVPQPHTRLVYIPDDSQTCLPRCARAPLL